MRKSTRLTLGSQLSILLNILILDAIPLHCCYTLLSTQDNVQRNSRDSIHQAKILNNWKANLPKFRLVTQTYKIFIFYFPPFPKYLAPDLQLVIKVFLLSSARMNLKELEANSI